MHFLGPSCRIFSECIRKYYKAYTIHAFPCCTTAGLIWWSRRQNRDIYTYNLYCVFLKNVIAHKIVEISTKISVFRPPDFKQGLQINYCLNVCQSGPLASARCTHLVQILTKPVFKVKICAQTVIFIYFFNQPSVGQKTQLFSKSNSVYI